MAASVRCFGLGSERRDIDADRKDVSADDTPEGAQHAVTKVFGPGPAQQIIAKAVQIRLGLKPNQVIGAQCFGEIAVVRQHAPNLGGRKRRM